MLTTESATTLARLVQAGEITAPEIVAAHLPRIAAIEPAVGAFQVVRADRAIAEAAALMVRADRRELPLAGVPVAIKDNVPVAPFTGGWNFAGFSAASVPAGRHSTGLPLSVQIIGSRGRETLILSLARQLEILQLWPRHAPASRT